MNYAEFISYHKRGDAGVEGRTNARIGNLLKLDDFDRFRLVYFYSMTYNIPSALDMLLDGCFDMRKLKFRTDRRYVRCNGAYDRLLDELTSDKMFSLQKVKSSEQAYKEVSSWYFFGRYASFLFLEGYSAMFQPKWNYNLKFKWEPDENYTLGAELVIGSKDHDKLDAFLEQAKSDANDNEFALETSLCGVWKIHKGTRWDGYYTERMLAEADKSKHASLIYKAL